MAFKDLIADMIKGPDGLKDPGNRKRAMGYFDAEGKTKRPPRNMCWIERRADDKNPDDLLLENAHLNERIVGLEDSYYELSGRLKKASEKRDSLQAESEFHRMVIRRQADEIKDLQHKVDVYETMLDEVESGS